MVKFELEGHEYKTPDGWHEVKFSKFLQFLEEIQPLCPKALLKAYESENIELYWGAMSNRNKARCYQYFAKAVGFWVGLPYEIIQKDLSIEQLEAAYWAIEVDLSLENSQINEDFTGFTLGDKEYLLPQRHMVGSTVLEFTESAHFEQQMEDVKNGKWLALLDIMAVLCRPKGEVYNYEKGHHEMRKNIFKNVTMDIVLNVSFFLFRLNEALNKDLMIYSLLMLHRRNSQKQYQKNMDGVL